jgi:hypothetical protein
MNADEADLRGSRQQNSLANRPRKLPGPITASPEILSSLAGLLDPRKSA